MEVKSGYKQTEIGVIPEDWDVKTFGQIFDYQPTATNSRSDLNNGGETYYIHYGDIHTRFHNHLNFKIVQPPQISRTLCRNAALLKNGDWVMADASEDYDGVGKSVEIQGLDENTNAISGLHTFVLREKTPTFAAGFKGHLGNLELLHSQLLKAATGMKVYGVSKTALKDLKLPIPTKAEQEAIADALSDTDAWIESLEQLIAKKRQIKQGAMQGLLTAPPSQMDNGKATKSSPNTQLSLRLPGFSGEWEVKTFDEIFNFQPTATNSRSDLADSGDTCYIHYGDIHTRFHGHLDFEASSPPKLDRSKCRNASQLQNGDWIMADASEDYDGVGKAIEVVGLKDGIKAVSGLHTFLLREKSATYVPRFKGHLGNLKSLHESYLQVATGMKVYGVSKTALRHIELPVPGPAEQTAIAEILSDMDSEIEALEAKLRKACQIKQGMMQELLTGKTRLV